MEENPCLNLYQAVYRAHDLIVEANKDGSSIADLLRQRSADGIALALERHKGKVPQAGYMYNRVNTLRCSKEPDTYRKGCDSYKVPVPPYLQEKELSETLIALRIYGRMAQLMGYLLCGSGDKNIASKLGISTATVRTFIGRLFKQFDVQDRTELVVYVLGYINFVSKGKNNGNEKLNINKHGSLK